MPRYRSHAATAFLLAWALSATPALQPLTAADTHPSTRGIEPEKLEDPPGRYDPRADPLARSAGLVVRFGSYTSVQVNVDGLGLNIVGDAANEPSIAVNPKDPANLVIGWRQFDTITSNFRQAGWAYTNDKGQSWTFPGVLTPGVFRSDPVLDADSEGRFYYQSLRSSFDVDVFGSTNGGNTWGAPAASFGGDKNWMVVDRTSGPGDGHVYGIWQRFAGCCGFDVFTRSTGAGVGFEPPVPVALSPTFGTLAVGPAGEVYAAGIDGSETQDFTTFVVARSGDAEDPASPPTFSGTVVELGGSLVFSSGPNPGGLLGQVNVWADAAPGPTNGNVYLVASVNPDGSPDPLDVHFSRSNDDGASWSAPIRVNDDASTSNWQWFAAHSVAPNRRIDVIWNDTRNSGVVNVSQLYYAYSWNAGQSWSANVPVSPSFNSFLGWPQQQKLGDYYTIRSDATGADVAYAATFNGEQDVYYVRLFPDCNANAISDVIDTSGGGSSDCDLDRVPDECQAAPACAGAGEVPDLTASRVGSGEIELSWGASCFPGDGDFAVYEGLLGDFTSQLPVTCTTGGERVATFTPAEEDSYYLVAPRNLEHEGSYGTTSAGVERPQGTGACLPQQIHSCFALP